MPKKLFPRLNGLFLLTVFIPTLLAGIYFGLVASDVYISESHFIVRGAQRQITSSFGQILQNAGLAHAQEDTAAVHNFMLSRDALRHLEDKLGLAASFSSPDVDRISRFGGLDWDLSFEALHRYYQKRVTVALDTASSISTLSVRAFSAEEAYKINSMLLDMSEQLVNELNTRAREDMIHFASAEVERAEVMAKKASKAISVYRNEKGIFDPKQQSGLQLQHVSRLQDELLSAKTQLAQLRSASPHNPAIPVLQRRVTILTSEIESELGKVAGAELSFSVQSPEYERLMVDQASAENQLAAALATLQQARNEAMRKHLYLERIAHPNKPDIAVEPRRLRSVLAVFALGMIAWGILSLLLAGVREHRD